MEEGFEEWDADFLDQLIQVEELALSSSSSSFPKPIPSQPTAPPFTFSNVVPLLQQQQSHQQQHRSHSVSYSPPRELSQRPTDFNNNYAFDRFSNGSSALCAPLCQDITISTINPKDLEIDRLKKELGRVSKQLMNLERECCELRKERKRKEEQIKSVYSNTGETGVGVPCFKNSNLELGVLSVNSLGVSLDSKDVKASEGQMGHGTDIGTFSKAVGVQTDSASDDTKLDVDDNLSSACDLSNKLLCLWGSASDQSSGRILISKLFMACSGDFNVLFGCMSMRSSKLTVATVACGSICDSGLQCCKHSFHTSEATKVSHLYTVLTKVGNGLLRMETLFEPLLDLCNIKNCTLLRVNVKIEGLCSGINTKDRGLFVVGKDETPYMGYSQSGISSSDMQVLCKKGCRNADAVLSCVNWISVFELMQQIATTNNEECVRLEAVSIMNVILMRSNSYTERERIGQQVIFERIAQLLRKEAGSLVQKEVLHLIYLLLNCPKTLSIFCCGCGEGETDDVLDDNENAPTFKSFSTVLEGVADCIAYGGNNIQLMDFQDIELRKRATIILAFLASSGKSGFEILLSHKLHGEANFLSLILQVLASEMDFETVPVDPLENVKARTLFVREALILLNRLVSNPVYSACVLRALTASREMASLTIYIASRFSRKEQKLGLSDNITRTARESEIVDLARVFRKRIFTYLGDNTV